ncbi:hypothetical protein BGX23_003127, partial [Mortierella sp. AD031]
MPGAFKESRANDSDPNSRLHGTSSTHDPIPNATAMRASNVINPHGQSFEVAGPTTGGSPTIHNRALDTVKGAPGHDLSSSGTPPGPGLVETVKENATAAATGAAAAGTSIIAAAKNLVGRSKNENEMGEHAQHDSILPISNQSVTSTATPATTTMPVAMSSPGLSHSKPLGPHDRPPARVAIHAQKPSDKATYGNLDSPGAQNHIGPLSDRALAGTPPPSALTPRTIADPFGPVKVANWNDGKRQPDAPTPTSEDFDSPHFGPMHDRPEKPSTPPTTSHNDHHVDHPVHASTYDHHSSTVPATTAATAATVAAATHPSGKSEYFPHVHNSTTTTPHKEPLGERIKEAFHHEPHPTTTAATTATTMHQPMAAKEPLGERIKDILHHDSTSGMTHHTTEHGHAGTEKRHESYLAAATFVPVV